MEQLFQADSGLDSLEKFKSETSDNWINHLPKEGNVFGFWMQTLADLQFLDLELSGLADKYSIDPIKFTVEIEGNLENIRKQIAHLDLVNSKQTLYSELIDLFGDTNAYFFHNLYPYKGKYYPRLVRSLINAFKLKENATIFDPFNGCGTTTHEASMMGYNSIGFDINPIGVIISELKNELLELDQEHYNLREKDLFEIFNLLEEKKLSLSNKTLEKLFYLIYFDTKDAFERTTRFNKKGSLNLFIQKFNYIKDCYQKTNYFVHFNKLKTRKAKIFRSNVLDFESYNFLENQVDAVITSPPYYFSLDYVGKDKIAYDYLNEINYFSYNMIDIKKDYIGMKFKNGLNNSKLIDRKIISYFEDLEISIKNIYKTLKNHGKLAIVIGDSTIDGKKLPTTIKTHEFCINTGFVHKRTIFNPLLGARNRAIRGESVLIYEKNS